MTAQPAPALLAWGAALPRLRLPASAYAPAWGGCAASGLRRKTVCAYDEDPVTLAIDAARQALGHAAAHGSATAFDALFLGATTLPYEEKPSVATVLTALGETRTVRAVELRGSVQAGLQALAAAFDYARAHPGHLALAIAADAPAAPADAPYEHALAAGAAAFLVGSGPGAAILTAEAAVSIETFGARFRRRGDAELADLELRTRDDDDALARLAAAGLPPADWLAAALPPRTAAGTTRRLNATTPDSLWPHLGDAGAASAPLALADTLDTARAGQSILALALGAGAQALCLSVTRDGPAAETGKGTITRALEDGESIDYLSYLRHRRMLSTRFGGTA